MDPIPTVWKFHFPTVCGPVAADGLAVTFQHLKLVSACLGNVACYGLDLPCPPKPSVFPR